MQMLYNFNVTNDWIFVPEAMQSTVCLFLEKIETEFTAYSDQNSSCIMEMVNGKRKRGKNKKPTHSDRWKIDLKI